MKRFLATLAIAIALTVVAASAWAYWSAGSMPGGSGAAAASSVNQGATPTASATGASVTVSWAATTLANGQAVSGYLVKRYDAGTLAAQTVLSACNGTIATTSCVESGVPNGSWKYAVTPVFATNWQGPESAKSATVTVNNDTTAPTNSISLSSVTGGAYLTGTAIYYRGTAAGSLRLTNAVADAGSGPASSSTAALTGTSTGWSHTPSSVSTPAGGPFVSNAFDWTAGTTTGPGEAVTGRDVAGNTAVTNLTFTDDSTPPTAGTISYADGFSAGRSVSINFTSGTDAGAGIATRRLQRAVATLNGTTCATFGSFNDIGADSPASPYVDGSLPHGCYRYRYVVTDRVGNQDIATSASTVKVSYAGGVGATPGLLSHWRLGEAAATLTSTDSFTGTSGSALTSHTGELGATWAHQAGGADAQITDANRIRRSDAGILQPDYTIDYTTATPPSADYSVEADLVVRSNMTGDMAGVIGRHNTATNTFYMARWEQSDASWNLVKYTNGTVSYLNYAASQPALVVNEAYRIRLEMTGTTLNLYVNGVLKVTTTDATITAAGKAGIMDGNNGGSSLAVDKTNTTGIHFDNFQVTPSTYPRAADDKGTNTGDYENGVTLGAPGALAAGTNTAATFDGVNDYVQMTNTTGFPAGAGVRSTELWFKTSSAARQVLFRYGSAGNAQEYGLWIDAGGTTMTAWGWGTGNDKVFTLPSAVNNGAWHQVVLTYSGTTITLFIDGVALTAGPGGHPRDDHGHVRVRHRGGHPALRRQLGRVLQRLDRRGVLLHHGPDPGPGHRSLPAGRSGLRRRERTDRRLDRRHGPDGHRVALLHLDEPEPGAGQGHRPQRRRHHGQPDAARDRDPDQRCLRHLRVLRAHHGWDRPGLAEGRHRGRPGLLLLPVRRARHHGQRHDLHQPGHQGRHHRAVRAGAGVLGASPTPTGPAAAPLSTTAPRRPRAR